MNAIGVRKDLNKIDAFASSFFHFRDRLQERYKIKIDYDEYLSLCKIPVARIEKPFQGRKVGWLEVKNIQVLVVKEVNSKRRLITALPKKRAK